MDKTLFLPEACIYLFSHYYYHYRDGIKLFLVFLDSNMNLFMGAYVVLG